MGDLEGSPFLLEERKQRRAGLNPIPYAQGQVKRNPTYIWQPIQGNEALPW